MNAVVDVQDEAAYAYSLKFERYWDEEKFIQTWHMVKCARCGKKLSLFEATYNEKYAAVHKVCTGE